MNLRLIEMYLPEKCECADLLSEYPVLGLWEERKSDHKSVVRLLLDAEQSEPVLDVLESRFASTEGFRLMLFPVEATLPRPEPPEEAEQKESEPTEETSRGRISREELYADVSEAVNVSPWYVLTVALSAVVAAIGLMRGDVAIVVGAMVIAPLLGPNVALALATTLGDVGLAKRSLNANGVGVVTALILAVIFGALLPVDPQVSAILSRTEVGYGDVILALAAGIAGTLAFSRGAPTALVGVMVAVALLPPLVVCGLLAGHGEIRLAVGALLLVLTNVICVNLAGIGTFLAQGIHPRTWWEADRAKKTSTIAVTLWVALLAVLLVLIWLFSQG